MNPEENRPVGSSGEDLSRTEGEHEQDSTSDRSDRERSFARRALLRAGWTVPVILSVMLPQNALAGSVHGDNPSGHGDAKGGIIFKDHGDGRSGHGDATVGTINPDHGDGMSSGTSGGTHGDVRSGHADGTVHY